MAPGPSPTRGQTQLLTLQTERARLRDRRGGRLFFSVEHEYVVAVDAYVGPRLTTLAYLFASPWKVSCFC